MPYFTKASVGRSISTEYRSLSLSPLKEDTWVLDTRNGNLLGPFKDETVGHEMEFQLNGMVKRNGLSIQPFTLHKLDGTLVEVHRD